MDYTANARCLYKVELLGAEATSKKNVIGPDEPITTKSQVIQSEKFPASSVFRASANCSKILDDKKIFQYSEILQGNSVFQGKR